MTPRTIQQQQAGYPTLYVDGEPLDTSESFWDDEGARVQVEWDDVSNGYGEGLVNSAAIDWTGPELTVTISTGDPRGAFAMTFRVLEDGTRLLHVPYPESSWLHEPLTELHPGTYRVGS